MLIIKEKDNIHYLFVDSTKLKGINLCDTFFCTWGGYCKKYWNKDNECETMIQFRIPHNMEKDKEDFTNSDLQIVRKVANYYNVEIDKLIELTEPYNLFYKVYSEDCKKLQSIIDELIISKEK